MFEILPDNYMDIETEEVTGDYGVVLNYHKDFITKEYTYRDIWSRLVEFESYKSVVVVDADALVYRVASKADEWTIKATSDVWGVVECKTRTELKAHCKKNGWGLDSFRIEDVVSTEPVSYCLGTLKKALENIKKLEGFRKSILLIGGGNNFRSSLPLPDLYKGSRKDMKKPTHLDACRNYLIKYHNAFIINGVEADDVVVGLTQILTSKGLDCIAWNVDKDFTQSLLPVKYFNPIHQKLITLEGGVGELHLTKTGVKGSGLKWLLLQVMLGDSTDDYSPKQFFSKKYGDKGFYNDFHEIDNLRDLSDKWVTKWRALVGDEITFTTHDGYIQKHNWVSLAELYFLCAYMRVSPCDTTTLISLLDCSDEVLL